MPKSSGRLVPSGPLSALAAAALLTAVPARADSIRCDGGIVSERDSKVDLLGKCGEPSLREVREEERERVVAMGPGADKRDSHAPATVSKRVSVTVERWTYNFGSSRFLQFVTLENGRVIRIEHGSYGYEVKSSEEPVGLPRAQCDAQAFRLGEPSAAVMARCGPPASFDQKLEELTETEPLASGGGVTMRRSSTTETWIYDFGPQAFTRRLTFRDGTLRRIDSGNYGYSR